ncbi:MAG: hypothetical protein ACRDRG_01675 [Pseudonocardiaceae bacterium]
MKPIVARGSLILLCLSMAGAVGGGLYEQTVLTPIWSASPPSSFSIIQPGTGVPLQNFWIPVHAAITVFVVLSLVLTWRDVNVRRLLLIGLGSYIVMRAWSGLFFIPEMLAFQEIPLDSSPSAELSSSVASWTYWTWFREPLDIVSYLFFLLALFSLNRSPVGVQSREVALAAPTSTGRSS